MNFFKNQTDKNLRHIFENSKGSRKRRSTLANNHWDAANVGLFWRKRTGDARLQFRQTDSCMGRFQRSAIIRPFKKKQQEITFFSSKNNNGEKIPARLDFNKFQFKFRTKTFSNPKIEVEAETERVWSFFIKKKSD